MKISQLNNKSVLKNNDLSISLDISENATKKTNIKSIVRTGFKSLCKIKNTPTTRGYWSDHQASGCTGYACLEPDDTLFFDTGWSSSIIDDVGEWSSSPWRVNLLCRAFFTGAPPLGFIVEPSFGPNIFQKPTKIQKYNFFSKPSGRPSFTQISAGHVDGYIVETENIKSLTTINTNFSDNMEPKFFNQNDINSHGYIVDIDFILNFGPPYNPPTPTATAPSAPDAAELGASSRAPIWFRWCSAIEGFTTTLESGFIKITKI